MKESNHHFYEVIARFMFLCVIDPEILSMKSQKEKLARISKLLARPEDDLATPDFVKIEKNVASMGFFSPPKRESKKARTKTVRFNKTIEGARVEVEVRILATEDTGLPTTADQDKYLALLKLVNDQMKVSGMISNPFRFQYADILRELDLSDAGENYKEVDRWLDRMTTTAIVSKGAVFLANSKRWVTDRFHVFSRAISTGHSLDDGTTADCNYVWFSEWQLANLSYNYLVPIDFEAYKQLSNQIAKALVPLLQIWLYASQEDGFFEKRYDELCQILNLAQYKHASKIREKLGPALNELQEKQYISRWKVEQNASQEYFKVIFYHGEKFYRDRALRLGQTEPEILQEEKNALPVTKALPFEEPSHNKKLIPMLTAEQEGLINKLMQDFKLMREKAEQLVREHETATKEQLNAWSYREITPSNLAGWMIKAIEDNYQLPQAYLDSKTASANKVAAKSRHAAIADCPYCKNSSGMRFTIKGARPCTHDPAKEEFDPELIKK